MDLILAFVQLILIVIIALVEYRNASISVFLWATLFIMFGLPHFLAVLTQTFIFPDTIYTYASLFVIVFNILYLIFRYVFKKIIGNYEIFNIVKEELNKDKNYFENKNNDFSEEYVSKKMLLTLVLFFILFLSFIISKYGSILNTSWGTLYSDSVDIYSLKFG